MEKTKVFCKDCFYYFCDWMDGGNNCMISTNFEDRVSPINGYEYRVRVLSDRIKNQDFNCPDYIERKEGRRRKKEEKKRKKNERKNRRTR